MRPHQPTESPKISPPKDVKRRSERVRTQISASTSVNRAPKALPAALVDSPDTSEHDPQQTSVSSDTEATQAFEEFIRDAVSRKESKSEGFKGDGR